MTRSHAIMICVAVALFAFVPAGSTHAQSRQATTEELTARADVVALGRVADVASEWNETRSMIRTRVTLAVDRVIKGGTAGGMLTLYVPGGEVGGVGEIYSHAAAFKKDEDVLVFAERDAQGRYRVAGGQQGKYVIVRDETTGRPLVGGTVPLETVTARIQKAVSVQNGK